MASYSLETMQVVLERVEKKLDDFIEHTENTYISKAEFLPVRNLVYGACGIILMAVFGAIVALVVI